MKSAIIMAAGKGTRMHSDLPKVLHKVCQKPMLQHILDTLNKLEMDRIVTVVGYGRDQVMAHFEGQTEFAVQDPQMGTGHAVMQASTLKNEKGKTLVINGDCPCITQETYEKILAKLDESPMVILTTVLDDAASYGRVVRDETGKVEKIVEFKDCNEAQKEIKEINAGIYGFDNETLFAYLEEVKNENAQGEYYITDLVEIYQQHGAAVSAVVCEDHWEVEGVNDCLALSKMNKRMHQKINEAWMLKGVQMIDPDSTYIGKDVILHSEVQIYPNCTLEGKTVIGKGTTLLPNCFLVNAKIGENCIIDASRISDSEVKDDCTVGPFAHLRMNSIVESKNRIGNFVEFKNTTFGIDSRCAHLTYIGDADIGSKVNIGCGVVTVNYDGKNKFRTTVKDGAFIGSNVNLIAPITVGENAVVAAGSTATEDVADSELAIARSRQVNKPGYGLAYKTKDDQYKKKS